MLCSNILKVLLSIECLCPVLWLTLDLIDLCSSAQHSGSQRTRETNRMSEMLGNTCFHTQAYNQNEKYLFKASLQYSRLSVLSTGQYNNTSITPNKK